MDYTHFPYVVYSFCDTLLQVLEPMPQVLNEKHKAICDSLGEFKLSN